MEGEGDFLDAHMIMIDLINAIFAPSLICIMGGYSANGYSDKDNMLSWSIGWTALSQGIFMMIAITVTRVSEDRPRGWRNCMPEFLHYCIIFAMTVVPGIVIIMCVIGVSTMVQLAPLLTLVALCQTLIIVWYVNWPCVNGLKSLFDQQH